MEKCLQIKLLALSSFKNVLGYNKSQSDRELHGVGVFCFGFVHIFFPLSPLTDEHGQYTRGHSCSLDKSLSTG